MTCHLAPALRATACGVGGGWNHDGEGRRDDRPMPPCHHNTSRHPPARGVGRQRGGVTTAMMMMAPRTEQHTTCPQPHEQLLVGWLVGGTTTGRPWEHGHNQPLRRANKTTQRDDNNNNSGSRGWTTWPQDPDDTHQDNASWTTCSPGPTTCLQDEGEKVDHHPIACGVERGCYVSGTGA